MGNKHIMQRLVVLPAAMIALTTSASAITIDFNDFPETNPSFDYRGFVVIDGGFRFENSVAQAYSYLQWSGGTSYNADPTGHTLSHNIGFTTTTLTKVGGGVFDFTAIDLGDIFNIGSVGQVDFSWTPLSGPMGSASVFLDRLVGLQTFAFNVPDVTEVTFKPISTDGGWLQFDNVVLESVEVPLSPLGAGWLAWLAAALAAGATLRRRAA